MASHRVCAALRVLLVRLGSTLVRGPAHPPEHPNQHRGLYQHLLHHPQGLRLSKSLVRVRSTRGTARTRKWRRLPPQRHLSRTHLVDHLSLGNHLEEARVKQSTIPGLTTIGQVRRRRRKVASIEEVATIRGCIAPWRIPRQECTVGFRVPSGIRGQTIKDVQPLRGGVSNACTQSGRRGVRPGLSGGLELSLAEAGDGPGCVAGERRSFLPSRSLGRFSGHGSLCKHGKRWNSGSKGKESWVCRRRGDKAFVSHLQPQGRAFALVRDSSMRKRGVVRLACHTFQEIHCRGLQAGLHHRLHGSADNKVVRRRWSWRRRGGGLRGRSWRRSARIWERSECWTTGSGSFEGCRKDHHQEAQKRSSRRRGAQSWTWSTSSSQRASRQSQGGGGARRIETEVGTSAQQAGWRCSGPCRNCATCWHSCRACAWRRRCLFSLFVARVYRLCGARSNSRERSRARHARAGGAGRSPGRPSKAARGRGSSEEEEEEETESGSEAWPSGHKRWYYERLTKTAGTKSRRERRAKGEKEEGRGKEEQGQESWPEAAEDPYGCNPAQEAEAGRQREEGEKEKEREEEGSQEESQEGPRWGLEPFGEFTDDELRRGLGERMGRNQLELLRGQIRATFETQVAAAPRFSAETVGGSCTSPAGPDLKSERGEERRRSDTGDQTSFLLQHSVETPAPKLTCSSEGASLSQPQHGLTSLWPAGQTGGCDGIPVHRRPPVHHRRWLGGCEASGVVAHGGSVSSWDGGGAAGSSPCAHNRKSLESGCRSLEEPGQSERRKRQVWQPGRLALRWQRQNKEGRPRQRKRKAMVGATDRPGRRFKRWRQEEGEARRKGLKRLARTQLLGSPEQLAKRRRLAQAFCQEAESKVDRREEKPQLSAEISLRELAARCTSFCVIGVALAWWTVAGVTSPCNPSFTDGLIEGWLVKAVARFQSTQRRERGVTFPIRLGELEGLKDALLSVSFDTALSPKFVDLWCRSAWLFLCIAALNDLAGTVPLPLGGGWSTAELRAVGSLQKAVDRRCRQGGLSFETSESAWQKEMSSKRVGYSGEEISTCQELSWDQVIAALPPEEHGACIDTLEWVSPRTREFLLDPSRLLKDPQTVVLPKMPGRIHVKACDKMKIASELVKRRICDWIPLEKVYKIRGTPVLNGLFGVGKPSFLQDGRQVLRLIMNLTGSNATQEQLTGGCIGLPSIMSWQSIVLEENQGLSLFQSDMCSAFYLFRLPGMWKPHLCFNLLASGSDLGFSDSRQFALCCNVIPMGWLNSVGIMQEISENLMRWGGMNLTGMVAGTSCYLLG